MKLYDVDDDTRVLSNNTNNVKSDKNKDNKFSKFKTRLIFSPFYYICARSEGVARRKDKTI